MQDSAEDSAAATPRTLNMPLVLLQLLPRVPSEEGVGG